jgi:hypothetical protein
MGGHPVAPVQEPSELRRIPVPAFPRQADVMFRTR